MNIGCNKVVFELLKMWSGIPPRGLSDIYSKCNFFRTGPEEFDFNIDFLALIGIFFVPCSSVCTVHRNNGFTLHSHFESHTFHLTFCFIEFHHTTSTLF